MVKPYFPRRKTVANLFSPFFFGLRQFGKSWLVHFFSFLSPIAKSPSLCRNFPFQVIKHLFLSLLPLFLPLRGWKEAELWNGIRQRFYMYVWKIVAISRFLFLPVYIGEFFQIWWYPHPTSDRTSEWAGAKTSSLSLFSFPSSHSKKMPLKTYDSPHIPPPLTPGGERGENWKISTKWRKRPSSAVRGKNSSRRN